jgi:hypothetical protein
MNSKHKEYLALPQIDALVPLVVVMKFYVFILLCVSALVSEILAECYYPDGKVAPGLIPCNSTAKVSHCCRDADVCLSNGLCFSTGLSSIVRRGCTDSTWNETTCPSFCTGGPEGRYNATPKDLFEN